MNKNVHKKQAVDNLN